MGKPRWAAVLTAGSAVNGTHRSVHSDSASAAASATGPRGSWRPATDSSPRSAPHLLGGSCAHASFAREEQCPPKPTTHSSAHAEVGMHMVGSLNAVAAGSGAAAPAGICSSMCALPPTHGAQHGDLGSSKAMWCTSGAASAEVDAAPSTACTGLCLTAAGASSAVASQQEKRICLQLIRWETLFHSRMRQST